MALMLVTRERKGGQPLTEDKKKREERCPTVIAPDHGPVGPFPVNSSLSSKSVFAQDGQSVKKGGFYV
jgi:hypothetical protein